MFIVSKSHSFLKMISKANRLPFKSIYQQKDSAIIRLNHISIAQFKQKYNSFGEEIDDETDLGLDARTTVNKFLESYARRDINTVNVLIESFFQLQGARLGKIKSYFLFEKCWLDVLTHCFNRRTGIRVDDISYRQFLDITEQMIKQRDLTPAQVKTVAWKLQSIGVFSKSIWKTILQYTHEDSAKMSGVTYIEIIYSIFDSKGNVGIEEYIRANEQRISQAILKTEVNILAFVQGVYLLSKIRDLSLAEKTSIRSILLLRESEIYSKFNANQLADIIHLVYDLFGQELHQEDIQKFLKKTIDVFIIKDLAEYDNMLQQYEFKERKNNEIGILDNLKWSSAAKVITVIADDTFYDSNLIRRMEDLIFRKSETDLIDLDSASILLESLSLIEIAEVSVLLRMLEMIDRRFVEEGKYAHESVHPPSIPRLLTVLNHFIETDIALEFCDRLQNYLAGLVKSGDIDERLNEEVLIELKTAFEESPICHLDKDLFTHMSKLLQKKLA